MEKALMIPASSTPSLRLLHIDDDPVNLLVLDQLLTVLGHRPLGVASAGEAVAWLARERFDAVLSDIHMPDLGGVELLQELSTAMPDLPVFAVTADAMTRTQADYRALGFAGVLAKPITMPALRDMLSLVGRPRAARPFFAHGVLKG
jgi:two-component system sensor histidine kinase EvgS